MVGRHSQRANRGLEALSNGRDGSGGPLGGSVGFGRPSRTAGKGWEALPECWDGSAGPPREPAVVDRPSWMTGRGREAFPEGREAYRDLPKGQEGSEGHAG